MEKQIYRMLGDIIYKKQKYRILSNEKYQKYFLKILDDGSLLYPTLEEFEELYKIYNEIPLNNNVYADISEKMEDSDKEDKRKIYKLIPKVIYKGALISLASAMVLIGSFTLTNKIFGNQSTEELIKGLAENGNEIELLSEDTFQIKSLTNKDDEKQILYTSREEFKKYLEIKNPTYDDIKQIIEQNSNIPEEYKTWLRDGISNMEKQLPDIDLSVLYYNLSRMKVALQKRENIQNELEKKAGAYFNPSTGEVVLGEENIDSWTFLHEVLGHGTTEAEIPDMNIAHTIIVRCLNFAEEDKTSPNIFNLGKAVEEGKAEMITQIATGKSMDNSHYRVEPEELRIFLETTGTTLSELINEGLPLLINRMSENDIEKPIYYLEMADFMCNTALSLETEFSNPENIGLSRCLKEYFYDYADDKIKRGEDPKVLAEKMHNIVDNCYYPVHVIFAGEDIVDFTIMEYLADDIADEILDEEERG